MDNKQKATLVGAAHSLKPVVMIGNKGLTVNVMAEVDQALNAHELIKIKVSVDEKEARIEILEQIAEELNAEFLKLIGNIGIMYRKKES